MIDNFDYHAERRARIEEAVNDLCTCRHETACLRCVTEEAADHHEWHEIAGQPKRR